MSGPAPLHHIELPSGTTAALVRTDGAARGLVIAPDIFGLRPLFEDHVTRLAAETGWSVCAVEPFPGREDLDLAGRLESQRDWTDDRRLGDLIAGADATGCDLVGLIGFCQGGMYALKAAATGRFDRIVAFYGMIHVPEDWRGPGQGEPLEALAHRGGCEVMSVIGTADYWTPADQVDELVAAGVTVVRYEGADHGFVHDPARPAHRPEDAADAWRRTLGFLAGA